MRNDYCYGDRLALAARESVTGTVLWQDTVIDSAGSEHTIVGIVWDGNPSDVAAIQRVTHVVPL